MADAIFRPRNSGGDCKREGRNQRNTKRFEWTCGKLSANKRPTRRATGGLASLPAQRTHRLSTCPFPYQGQRLLPKVHGIGPTVSAESGSVQSIAKSSQTLVTDVGVRRIDASLLNPISQHQVLGAACRCPGEA